MSKTDSMFSWPGYHLLQEVDGSAGGVSISHGMVKSPKTNGVEAVLPAGSLLFCAHLGGSIWMRNRSNFTNFARKGGPGSANMGIGDCRYEIEYQADRCEFVAFMIERSWIDIVLDDRAKSARLEFIDPQNRPASKIVELGRMALHFAGKRPVDRLLADTVGYAAAAGIIGAWSNLSASGAAGSSAKSAAGDNRMRQVRAYIEANLLAPITLIDLATVADLPIPDFIQQFKAAFGKSPYRWIDDRKAASALS